MRLARVVLLFALLLTAPAFTAQVPPPAARFVGAWRMLSFQSFDQSSTFHAKFGSGAAT